MSQKEMVDDAHFVTSLTAQVLKSPKRSMRSPKRLSSPGRRGSPERKYADITMDTEVNRALARELYVESTVNVVNPSSRKSAGKVKPGQMNLFNPRG